MGRELVKEDFRIIFEIEKEIKKKMDWIQLMLSKRSLGNLKRSYSCKRLIDTLKAELRRWNKDIKGTKLQRQLKGQIKKLEEIQETLKEWAQGNIVMDAGIKRDLITDCEGVAELCSYIEKEDVELFEDLF